MHESARSLFGSIRSVHHPHCVAVDPASGRSATFEVEFEADGLVPFPQVIVWENGRPHLFPREKLHHAGGGTYRATVPTGLLAPGKHTIQAEGCRQHDPAAASAQDWIKAFSEVVVEAPAPARIEVKAAPRAPRVQAGLKVRFGIHKHMHQPYYRAADPLFWDDEKTMIFDQRAGPYSAFIPDAVQQYMDGGLDHAGLSTSWSGSLIEQLERCEREGRCYGHYDRWAEPLRALAQARTVLGHARINFSAFGFFHPLMALTPARNIRKQIEWHRGIIERVFGVPASRILFPPETAFHVRMIPALKEAGVQAVIYDSIHRARACQGYPYAEPQEGMLPPNPAEQVNPAVSDWLQLQHVWAGSKISPSLLKPEYIRYEDPDGQLHTMIGVPAERYLGNEDARGGFGALRYPEALGQVYDSLAASGAWDARHPPFFLLHSDGDNYGGGADSYYRHNTGQLVKWIQNDPRFELTTVEDYLEQFPPDPRHTVHVEPGSWSGADNGDPQFMKWFSRYREGYSPDLNSWAVLTALQNAVHTVEDARPQAEALRVAERLMLIAETSCYWYWTGQDVWDAQVTDAANQALGHVQGDLNHVVSAHQDRTGPTIFPPWLLPENPGGQQWGHGGLQAAPREGLVHSFIYDVSGLKRVVLTLRYGGREESLPMQDGGPYPSRTGARASAHLFTCRLPAGVGDVRYFIEAEDQRGNRSRSALERVALV